MSAYDVGMMVSIMAVASGRAGSGRRGEVQNCNTCNTLNGSLLLRQNHLGNVVRALVGCR